MSFFEKVVTDIDSLEKEFLGPDYKYYNFIAKPSDLGIRGEGSVGALGDDIAGIIDYVQVLISGKGPANTKGQPLGDRFFLKTGGQCKDYKTGKLVSRSMYIDNVPTGAIPIVSNLSGVNFPEFRGLVPGVVDNIMDMNPLKMFSAFMEGSEPVCAEVRLPVIGEDGKNTQGSGFIPIAELKDLAKTGKIDKNIVSSQMEQALQGSVTKETFQNIMSNTYEDYEKTVKQMNKKKMSLDVVYYVSVSALFMYVFYKLLLKR
jgi:hypothetical protein